MLTGKPHVVLEHVKTFVDNVIIELEQRNITVVCFSGDTAFSQLLIQDENKVPTNLFGLHLAEWKRWRANISVSLDYLIDNYLPKFDETIQFEAHTTSFNSSIPFTSTWETPEKQEWTEALSSHFEELGDVKMEDLPEMLGFPDPNAELPEISVPSKPAMKV